MRADLALGAPPAFDRRFAACALVSLAVHGAVGWWTATARPPPAPERPPLAVTLRLAAAGTPRQPAPRPASVAPQPRAPAAPTQPLPRTAPEAVRQPLAMASPAASATPLPVPEAAPAPTAAALPTTPAASPAADDGAREAARQQALDGALATYRRQLVELIGRVREYPRVAALRGWEGEVRLHLRIARKGNLLGVVLERSSGFDILDRHATAMVENLPALPPLPETLESNEIQVVVPINYQLRSAT